MADFPGGPGKDVFNGTPDNDIAHGLGDDDKLSGAGGMDALYGEDGNDTLNGGDDIDFLIGGPGADIMSGGDGDDYFQIVDASDLVAGEQMDGGSGTDQLTLAIPTAGPIDLSNITITSVESLMAMGANYYGTVMMTAQQLNGFTTSVDVNVIQLTTGGTVTVNAGGRKMSIYLANAATTIDLRNDPENYGSHVIGGTANDVIYGSSIYMDRLSGGEGNDTLYGGSDRDNLSGDEGDDTLDGGANDDVLTGGFGNDTIYGGAGWDRIEGGIGVDQIYAGNDEDEISIDVPAHLLAGEVYDGGAGTDTLKLINAGTYDFTGVTLNSIERIENYNKTAILSSAQIAGLTYINGSVSVANSGLLTLTGGVEAMFLLNAAGNTVDGSAATAGFAVTGSAVGETITGSAFADFLSGGGGVDTINGGKGDDTLTGGAGADILHGGEGNDVFVYENPGDLSAGEVIDGDVGLDVIRASEFAGNVTFDFSTINLGGVEGIDTGSYQTAAKVTAAQLDALTAVNGNFTLANAGSVAMAGVVSAAKYGGAAAFTITLAAAGNTLDMTGYAIDFTNVFGQSGTDTVIGSNGNDNVYGGGGNDVIDGGEGNDRITGGPGTDTLTGGNGDDYFVLDAATDFTNGETYNGGAGLDILQLSLIFTVNLSGGNLSGIDGIDTAHGTVQLTAAQLDALTAVNGNFVLTTGGAVTMKDVVSAGNGFNIFTLAAAGNTLDLTGFVPQWAEVHGAGGNDTVIGGSGTNALYGNGGDDKLTGGGNNDDIDGGIGNDTLNGAGGDDILRSGTGTDSLSGGDGNDGLYFGATMTGADQADGGTGSDQLGLQGNYTGATALTFGVNSLVGIETLILLSGSDNRFGDSSGAFYSFNLTSVDANVAAGQTLSVNANTLRAGENLTFNGAAELDGSFMTFGGLGNDNLKGGQKIDGFYFGSGGRFGTGDIVDGQGQQAGGLDQLGLQGNYTGGNAVTFGAGQISGIEMIVLLSGSDTRFGANGSSFSYNLTMNDGNVAAGQKMIINANTLLAAETATFNGSAETNGFFQIFSGAGNDSLTGSQGADDIWGGGGVDTITGGLGADTLHGGAGDDIFRYTSTVQSVSGTSDSLLDFATGDKIDLSAIDAVTGGADNAFQFVGASAFVNNGVGQLQAIDNGGGHWTVSADLNGNGTADLVVAVTVTDAHSLAATDFVL